MFNKLFHLPLDGLAYIIYLIGTWAGLIVKVDEDPDDFFNDLFNDDEGGE